MCTGTHPYIPVPNTVEARFNFSTAGGVAQNVFNFELPSPADTAALAQLGLDLYTWWHDDLKSLTHSGAVLQSIILTALDTDSSPQLEYTTGMPDAGTAGDSLPDNVTLATKHTTALRGRSYRGRTYHVGLPASAIATGDTVQDTYANNLESAYDDLLGGDFVANDETFVIVSRCQDNAWLTTGVTTPVVNNFTDKTVDSMRRRLAGRGI